MANGQYVGVNGVARKVTSPYIGVAGVARNVTTGYVGVDGVARMFFAPEGGGAVVLEVEKITSDTYANDTTYTAEEFILLDIYPKTGGTVNVTYGGLTKTITDTSGAEEPNAQQVVYGTFNGVTRDTSPMSGELVIDGDYVAFGIGKFSETEKMFDFCACITKINNWGKVELIPDNAFSGGFIGCPIDGIDLPSNINYIGAYAFAYTNITHISIPKNVKEINQSTFLATKISHVVIPSWIESIGYSAFAGTPLKTVQMESNVPPTLTDSDGDGTGFYVPFGSVGQDAMSAYHEFVLEKIFVPKGCVDAYKTAIGWSDYADYIVEAT